MYSPFNITGLETVAVFLKMRSEIEEIFSEAVERIMICACRCLGL
jgi:hypothetical protein